MQCCKLLGCSNVQRIQGLWETAWRVQRFCSLIAIFLLFMVTMSWTVLFCNYLRSRISAPVLSKDADIDEEMAEMIASEIESLSDQLVVYEEKLKV